MNDAPAAPTWLAGGGELGGLIRAKDWSQTPLGAVARWPQSLRSAVSILLPSKAQICLFWGPDLVTIYNDAYRPALGLKHPWALGQPAREVWSEFWDEVLKPLFEGVLRTGEALRASDYPFALERHGFPEETYFDISYDPVRDESGEVGGIFCIVGETTGRVLGERRLRTLRDLGRSASEARSVDEVLQRACAVLEQNAHDVPFAVVADASGNALASCRAPVRDGWPLEAARAGEVVLEESELSRFGPLPGGPWPEPAKRAVVLSIPSAGQSSCAFLVAGASPRLALDEPYLDFLRLVASSIAAGVSAARALEEQRAQAQALAELDRAKTAFFSNVSHEFRTPLTLLLGPLHDALAAGLSEAQRPAIESARRNAVRLQKLVNALLDFSRIEAGRAKASYAPTDLAKFTAELASNFRSACDKAGLRLEVSCPPLSRPVYVDRGMWEKIVLNLLSNALKFTFDGAIELALTETPAGAELRVADTGTGIAADQLPRLFERFHRIEGARARTHEGSGIGLAFVRELARMHGGDIRAQSEPERGSTFTVTLPFGPEQLPADQVVSQPSAASATPEVAMAFVEEAMGWLPAQNDAGEAPAQAAERDTRILVVDDNADMRAYVCRLLGARWTVDPATNGRRALEMLGERSYDLVLSDVMMPELDGFGLLAQIRARPALAELPVVLLSARAGEEAHIDGLAAGADDYIVKPFTSQQLIAQVAAQLKVRETRRIAAQDRERQRENLLSLFMKAPNPIVILRGPQHVIELANPPACEVWGRSEAQVLGRPLYEALPELHGQGFQELLDGVLRSGTAYEGKEAPARFRRAEGSVETVFFNFVYTPLRDANDRVDGILVTAFNVTDEVRARHQVSALHAQAEAANRSKDDFIAMLSHELRNPLAAIVSSTQLMRLRGDAVPELATLERQAAHLTRLVDDLLDVSRITRGKIELKRRVIELGEVVRRAVEMASGLLAARSHAIDLADVAPSGLAVEADADRLAQVVFNLVSNAAKYSDAHSPIAVRAWREGELVKLSVRDQGAGIAADMIERIFDMFVQQNETAARSGGGLGLGLTIVRSLMELHGGSVSARSAGPGQGAEFTIELPAATAVKSPPLDRPAPRPAAARKRVLIVDDNVDAGTALAELVRILGHEVRLAHEPAVALREAETFRADVALLDIGLPGMDGYELARRLRAHGGASNGLRLVAVTGYGQQRDRQRSSEAGLNEHLVKPVDLQALERLLAS